MLNMFKNILKWFVFILSIHCTHLRRLNWKEWYVARHFCVPYSNSRPFYRRKLKQTKTVSCIRCVMVCKMFCCSEFPKKMEKTGKCKIICFSSKRKNCPFASIHSRYFFRMETDIHSGILMSLFLLVAETIKIK